MDLAVTDDTECTAAAERLESLRCRRAYALAQAEHLKSAILLAFGSMVRNVNGL